MDVILFAFFVLLLMVLICHHKKAERSGFVSKPTEAEIAKYGGEIIKNQHLLQVGFSEAKNAMPWMDAVVYEEARDLARKNKLNSSSVGLLFH